MHITHHGTGDRTYVGVHGWNGSHRTFDPLVPHVTDQVTLYAFDLPGYGRSAPPEDWTVEAVADRVASALDAELSGPIAFVGNCSGAPLSIFITRRLSTPVDAIYMLEPFAFVPWYLRLLLTPLVGRFFYWTAFDTRLGRAISNAALADQRDEETDMMVSFADTPTAIPYHYLGILDRLEAHDWFADLQADITLVEAGHTFRAVRDSVDTWRSIWPDARHLTVDDAGHLLLEEAPDRVADILFDTPNLG